MDASAPLDVDLPPIPSIPSGQADNEPPRPEAPLVLPPAAGPPIGQPASELQTEPASLEPPGAIAAEPMAAAPRQGAGPGRKLPLPGVEEVQLRADVNPLPEAARAPGNRPAIDPVAIARAPAASVRREVNEDVVTLLEISPARAGGLTETPLPGNRAGSPPSPLPAPRIGGRRPVARRVAYALIALVLTLVFVWLFVDLFRSG